jgi:hypothetical protein
MRNSWQVLAPGKCQTPKKWHQEFLDVWNLIAQQQRAVTAEWTGQKRYEAYRRCESYIHSLQSATSRSSNVVLKKPKTNKRRNIISHSSSVSQGINKRRDYTIVIIVIREFVFVCQRSTRRATSYLKLVGGKCYSKRDHTRPSDRVPYSKGIIRRIYWFKFMM